MILSRDLVDWGLKRFAKISDCSAVKVQRRGIIFVGEKK